MKWICKPCISDTFVSRAFHFHTECRDLFVCFPNWPGVRWELSIFFWTVGAVCHHLWPGFQLTITSLRSWECFGRVRLTFLFFFSLYLLFFDTLISSADSERCRITSPLMTAAAWKKNTNVTSFVEQRKKKKANTNKTNQPETNQQWHRETQGVFWYIGSS